MTDDELIAQRINERRQRGVVLPVESGLHSGSLDRNPPEARQPAPKPEEVQPALDARRGLTGITSAIRQVAGEMIARAFDGLRITGDNTIGVHGKGQSWGIKFNTPLSLPPVGGGRLPQVIVPWQPIPAATANKVIIEPFATLLDLDLTNVTISGFATEWTLVTGDIIYLEMSYTAGVLDTVTLIGGAPWSGSSAPFDYPVPVETTGAGTLGDPYVVTKTRFLVAYTALATDAASPAGCMTLDDSGTAIKVIQAAFGPLALSIITMLTPAPLSFEYPGPPPRIP